MDDPWGRSVAATADRSFELSMPCPSLRSRTCDTPTHISALSPPRQQPSSPRWRSAPAAAAAAQPRRRRPRAGTRRRSAWQARATSARSSSTRMAARCTCSRRTSERQVSAPAPARRPGHRCGTPATPWWEPTSRYRRSERLSVPTARGRSPTTDTRSTCTRATASPATRTARDSTCSEAGGSRCLAPETWSRGRVRAMAVATDALPQRSLSVGRADALAAMAYALGAIALAGEAAVHVQQYASLVHEVRWIGPLFLAHAAVCVVAIIGLAYGRTRALAALAGVVVSALALGSLVVSYGHGLFGWHEGGFRTAVAIAIITEM